MTSSLAVCCVLARVTVPGPTEVILVDSVATGTPTGETGDLVAARTKQSAMSPTTPICLLATGVFGSMVEGALVVAVAVATAVVEVEEHALKA
ncbi:hypothetical protein GN244_ATG12812 [Phytophthora infestans]|uniref:Uncharacterized protein n=1 Tax=Phytophthora infestans TaxID=4787 RepID=A0A833WS11_PHYIN|nr:hypothetical protein GN244_ATG12812 [Phytophthora infestans]KAF4134793.1 hypothetical protein GN958_ATG16049 [Phytophthora infestans]